MNMNKRLDIYLFENGYFPSREKAKGAIMAGIVFINGKRIDKAGEKIKEIKDVKIKGNPIPYVSRGGLKLEKAFEVFDFEVNEKIAYDIGASTGGFTDCMLKNGAKKVYAIDVGYGQLAWKLRNNDKVICMEKTNFRYLEIERMKELAECATMDVSFISITKLVDNLYQLMTEEGEAIVLIKPQFEAGKGKIGKKGVVHEKSTHLEVLNSIINKIIETGFTIRGISYSPVKGPEGNIEFLCFISKKKAIIEINVKELIEKVVEKAHNSL